MYCYLEMPPVLVCALATSLAVGTFTRSLDVSILSATAFLNLFATMSFIVAWVFSFEEMAFGKISWPLL